MRALGQAARSPGSTSDAVSSPSMKSRITALGAMRSASQGACAVVRLRDAVAPVVDLEQPPQQSSQVRLVVDHENAFGHARQCEATRTFQHIDNLGGLPDNCVVADARELLG